MPYFRHIMVMVKNNFQFKNSPVAVADEGSVKGEGNVLNIFILGDIGGWWGVNKNDIFRQLKGKKKYDQINVVISSPGGGVDDAFTIHDLLKAYKANVSVYLSGICASAATIVACAGDKVFSSAHCIYMVHKPLFQWTGGNADDLRKDAEVLDVWEDGILNVYQERPNMTLSREELEKLVEDETFMSPNQALELGFIDEVVEALDIDFEPETLGLEDDCGCLYGCYLYDEGNVDAVYRKAMNVILKKGYSQYNVTNEVAVNSKNSIVMNKYFKLFVSGLVKAGLIEDKDSAKAEKALEEVEINAEDLIENLGEVVDASVAKLMEGGSVGNPLNFVGLKSVISGLGDDEKGELRKLLGLDDKIAVNLEEVEEWKEMKNSVNDLAGKYATLKVGEGEGGKDDKKNGESGFKNSDDGKVDVSGKSEFQKNEARSFYKRALNAGQISRAEYDKIMKQEGLVEKEEGA